MTREAVILRQSTKNRIVDNIRNRPELVVNFALAYKEGDATLIDVECSKCGHIKEGHSVRSFASKEYACAGCLINKYETHCEDISRTYISHYSDDKNQGVLISKCNVCAVVNESRITDLVSSKRVTCEYCLVDKYKQQSSLLNFKYVGREIIRKGVLSIKLKCQFGHSFPARASNLYQGKVICRECQTVSYEKALNEKTCKLLKVELNSGLKRRIFYTNDSGGVFSTTTSNLFQGRFATTLGGHWREKHSTYLISLLYNGTVYNKIGTAVIPSRRLKELKLLGEAEVFTLASFNDRFGADNLESELHGEFNSLRLDRSIANSFTTAIRKVKRKGQIERVAIKDGVTEWFTHEVYDILKTRYKLEEGSANDSQFDRASTLADTR